MSGEGIRSGEEANRARMTWAMGIALVYMLAELVGGILSNSLALLADAGHMATDVLSLGLALGAMHLATRRPDSSKSYGYYRAEILAALGNGIALLAVTGYVFYEAYRRLQQPPEVAGPMMLAVAAGGLVVNLTGLWLLQGGRDQSLNVRGAWLHVLADTLGSVGVIVGAVLVWGFGWNWADPVAGALIGAVILRSSWTLLGESVDILMAAVPDSVDLGRLGRGLADLDGVQRVHDLHVWRLTSGVDLATVHLEIEDWEDGEEVQEAALTLLRARHGIEHPTVQLEVASRRADEAEI